MMEEFGVGDPTALKFEECPFDDSYEREREREMLYKSSFCFGKNDFSSFSFFPLDLSSSSFSLMVSSSLHFMHE